MSSVAHRLYEFLPLIDKHSKACQNSLVLKKCWLTKNCWVRLLTTFFGMVVIEFFGEIEDSVMDMSGIFTDIYENMDEDFVDDFDVRKMANN